MATSCSDSTDISAPSFHQVPLQDANRGIRLLEILPSEDDGPIKCILTTHSLANMKDKFVAISYTWGKPGDEQKIYIDGKTLIIRQNCWYALWQMRSRDAIDTDMHRYYWIDSICIDQNNLDEKNAQIGLMGQIYSWAKLVAVCIGELDQDFIDLSRLSPRTQEYFWNPSSPTAADVQIRLCQREYFHRIWVVQECNLAKDMTVFCGSQTLPYSHWVERLCVREIDSDDTLPRIGKYRPPGLAHCVAKWSDRTCSDLHDKLYGFLSLAHPSEKAQILPDYSQPLWNMLLGYCTSMTLTADLRSDHWAVHRAMSSTLKLAHQLTPDVEFLESARRVALERMAYQSSAHQPLQSFPPGTITAFLHAAKLGHIWIPEIGSNMSVDMNQRVPRPRTIPDPDIDFSEDPNKHSVLPAEHFIQLEERIEDIQQSQPPQLAALVVDGRDGNIPLLVPWNARTNDIILQFTDLHRIFLVCREIDGEICIIGNAWERWETELDERRWPGLCGDCGLRRCRGHWKCHVHAEDLLSLALFHQEGEWMLHLPFTTPGTGSYVERQNVSSAVKFVNGAVSAVSDFWTGKTGAGVK